MEEEKHDRIKKIKNGIFDHLDVLEIDITFDKMMDKKLEENFEKLVETELLDEIESILKTGNMWKFNPTNIILFVKDNKFEYNRKALEASVLKIGKITHQAVDRNSNLYTLTYPLQLLLINAAEIDENLIIKSSCAKVRTLTGMVEI